MQLVLGSLEKIKSLNYLTAENCERYRAICSFAYHQSTYLSNQFRKEELMFFLLSDERFSYYTETMLEQDLTRLVEWGNLVSIQDTSDSNSISEFKFKRFLYSCSEETIAIERNLQEFFEKKQVSTAILEKNMIELLVSELQKINDLDFDNADTNSKKFIELVFLHWRELESRSKALRDNTQDFFNHVNSESFDKLANHTSFIPFKERFISYLDEFITEVDKHSIKIRHLIFEIDKKIDCIVDFVYEHLTSVPLINNDINKVALKAQWTRLKNWFISGENFTSNFELLNKITKDTIRRINLIVDNLFSSINNTKNRSADYKKLAVFFNECETVEEMKSLSSLVFGFDNCNSFFVHDTLITTESDTLPIIGEKEHEFEISELNSRSRLNKTNRTKTINKKEQEALLIKKQEELHLEKMEFLQLIKNNEIILKETYFSEKTLKTTLNLITSLIYARQKTKKSDVSIKYTNGDYKNVRLETLSDQKILVKATHGTLQFSDYKLIFGGN